MKDISKFDIPSISNKEKACAWCYSFFCYAILTGCRQCFPIAKPFLLGGDGISQNGGYAPFNSHEGSTLLGLLDSSFVLTYTVCSFFWAHKIFSPLQMQMRILLLALVGSAISLILFGLGFYWKIHSFGYFVMVQLLLGFAQSGAWSAVINIYYSIFDVEKGVLLFTVWAANSSVGNIVGRNIIAPVDTRYGWQTGFFVIAAISIFLGVLYPCIARIIINASNIKSQERDVGKQLVDNDEEQHAQANASPSHQQSNSNHPYDHHLHHDPLHLHRSIAHSHSSNRLAVIGLHFHQSYHSYLRNKRRHHHRSHFPVELIPIEELKNADVEERESVDGDQELPQIDPHNYPLVASSNVTVSSTSNPSATAATTASSSSSSPSSSRTASASSNQTTMILFVILYSLGLMFSKWMNYLMSLWLPVFLTQRVHFSDGAAGAWSSAFDVGSCLGMFVAFVLNFRYHRAACICFVMCLLSAGVLGIYSQIISGLPVLGNAFFLLLLGVLFSGPYTLISTVVTMDLSKKFGQSANTIISIVNGSGSAGSLFSGVFTAMVSNSFGWDAVLYMLIGLALVQLIPLGYISYTELQSLCIPAPAVAPANDVKSSCVQAPAIIKQELKDNNITSNQEKGGHISVSEHNNNNNEEQSQSMCPSESDLQSTATIV